MIIHTFCPLNLTLDVFPVFPTINNAVTIIFLCLMHILISQDNSIFKWFQKSKWSELRIAYCLPDTKHDLPELSQSIDSVITDFIYICIYTLGYAVYLFIVHFSTVSLMKSPYSSNHTYTKILYFLSKFNNVRESKKNKNIS